MSLKILLKGYYGYKNLGDDILMISAWHVINDLKVPKQISIFSDSELETYVGKLLRSNNTIVSSKFKKNFDLIFHGGGGIYFDFRKGSYQYLMLNYVIQEIGIYKFKRIFIFIKSLFKKNHYHTQRFGLGIGVGTFTSSSNKYYSKALELANYNKIFVRDKESLRNLRTLGFKHPISVSTDLAFFRNAWLPSSIQLHSATSNNRIAFILRDWFKMNHHYFEPIEKVSLHLKELGYQISFYSFDAENDRFYINKFSKLFKISVWLPNNQSLESFLVKLSKEDLIITSRAHGAIIGACLHIPSICLIIESKLKNVANMLNNSAKKIQWPICEEALLKEVNSIFSNYENVHERVKQDYINNSKLIKNSIAELHSEIIKYYEEKCTFDNT